MRKRFRAGIALCALCSAVSANAAEKTASISLTLSNLTYRPIPAERPFYGNFEYVAYTGNRLFSSIDPGDNVTVTVNFTDGPVYIPAVAETTMLTYFMNSVYVGGNTTYSSVEFHNPTGNIPTQFYVGGGNYVAGGSIWQPGGDFGFSGFTFRASGANLPYSVQPSAFYFGVYVRPDYFPVPPPPPPPPPPIPGGNVPEPSTWAMLVLGFGAIGASIRKRRRWRDIDRVSRLARGIGAA